MEVLRTATREFMKSRMMGEKGVVSKTIHDDHNGSDKLTYSYDGPYDPAHGSTMSHMFWREERLETNLDHREGDLGEV